MPVRRSTALTRKASATAGKPTDTANASVDVSIPDSRHRSGARHGPSAEVLGLAVQGVGDGSEVLQAAPVAATASHHQGLRLQTAEDGQLVLVLPHRAKTILLYRDSRDVAMEAFLGHARDRQNSSSSECAQTTTKRKKHPPTAHLSFSGPRCADDEAVQAPTCLA